LFIIVKVVAKEAAEIGYHGKLKAGQELWFYMRAWLRVLILRRNEEEGL